MSLEKYWIRSDILIYIDIGSVAMNIAVVLAGGSGVRVGADIPKQFIKVLDKPIMIYTLEAFEECQLIDRIVLVCIESHIEMAKKYCQEYDISKISGYFPGGKDFVDSCYNGLNSLKGIAADDDIVVITSADRPFISIDEIEDSIRVCEKYGSGIAARPCSLCMFEVDGDKTRSSKYLRETLMTTATPWSFKYSAILSALDDYFSGKITGCESYPVAIYAVDNEVHFSLAKAENFKITQKHDILLMESVLRSRKEEEQ